MSETNTFVEANGSPPNKNITDPQKRWERIKLIIPSLIRFFLIAGLGYLSWLATYTGMLELIAANNGALDSGYELAIGFATGMLMLMIIYLLDNLFSPIKWWLWVFYVGGYVFLTLISVGFGFGFYWKFLESKAEATRSAVSAVEQVETALTVGRLRLEQVQVTFHSLATLSARKAELEKTVGKTCPKSPPGDGPRRRLRDQDAKNFLFASSFVKQRIDFLNKDINALNGHISRIRSGAPGTIDPESRTRNAFLRRVNHKLNLTLTRYNAFRTDPQLIQFRDSFAKRANRARFDNGTGGKFNCPDPQLKLALLGVIRAIDELPQLEKTEIAAVEGAEAIVEAFRRLLVSTYALVGFDAEAISKGLTSRDYIPLFIAFFVDLCILLISINRPVNRLQGFLNRARKAHDTQMHEVLRRFHEVHDSKRSARLDIFHDVMFDIGPHQYVAVPIDLRVRPDNRESEQEFLNHKKRLTQARYLATLMVTMEEAGLVHRMAFISSARARRKLKKLKSPYAGSPGFRVYRFNKGAWPAIILDDMLGESKTLEQEKRLLPPPVKISENTQISNQEKSVDHDESKIDSPPANDNELEKIMMQEIETYLLDVSVSKDKELRCHKDMIPNENKFHHHDAYENEDTAAIEIDKIAQQFAPEAQSKPDDQKT